jgi:hypothetical protein
MRYGRLDVEPSGARNLGATQADDSEREE